MHVPGLLYLVLDDRGVAAFIAAYAIFVGLFVTIALALTIVIYWRIATKAGYHGALSLLMLVPVVHLIVLILFAFTEWPIEREVRTLRGAGRMPAMTT